MSKARDWWVAVTNTRMERRATQGLEQRGFEVYCPKRVMEFVVGRKRRPACRLVAGLPGYLFVRPRTGQPWWDMLGVDGIRGVLTINLQPLTLWRGEMDRLRRVFALDVPPPVEDAFKIGDNLRVTISPTTEFDAIMAGKAKDGRLMVTTQFLGRECRFEVDRRQCSNLEAA